MGRYSFMKIESAQSKVFSYSKNRGGKRLGHPGTPQAGEAPQRAGKGPLQPTCDKAENGGNDRKDSRHQLDQHNEQKQSNQSQKRQTEDEGNPLNGRSQHTKHTAPHRIRLRSITKPIATAKNKAMINFKAKGKADQKANMKSNTG